MFRCECVWMCPPLPVLVRVNETTQTRVTLVWRAAHERQTNHAANLRTSGLQRYLLIARSPQEGRSCTSHATARSSGCSWLPDLNFCNGHGSAMRFFMNAPPSQSIHSPSRRQPTPPNRCKLRISLCCVESHRRSVQCASCLPTSQLLTFFQVVLMLLGPLNRDLLLGNSLSFGGVVGAVLGILSMLLCTFFVKQRAFHNNADTIK